MERDRIMARKKVEIKAIRGKRLKELLTSTGITQEKLHEITNMSQQTISKIIQGKVNLTDYFADTIVEKFPNVRKSYLMGYDDLGLTEQDANGKLTICGMSIEEAVKILNGLELERKCGIKMTMENLSEWQEIIRKEYEKEIKDVLDSYMKGLK